jgi:hypothetical protein
MSGTRITRKKPTAAEFDALVEEAMVETPDPITPCLGCRHEARCRDEQLACAALSVYRAGLPESRYRLAPRVPSRGLYEVLEAVARRAKEKRGRLRF